ncbi:hypothetical protein [Massilia horti]|uniref:Uncharacterized protein n=1 Tax=Massilia horti TaxID=2562153 RepID=A0A4Y9T5U3_9BURK|nr:hypothetical protein [Massilia horti]TFW35656.1 hypothetical protein E4O92_01480 [Massilia horti]
METSTKIIERCASKEDIEDVRECIKKLNKRTDELEMRIELLETHIDIHFAEMKSEMIRWVGTVGILQMALISALALKLAS